MKEEMTAISSLFNCAKILCMNDLNYVDINDCKCDGKLVKAIRFKPKKAQYIITFIGILLMIPNNLFSRLLGAFCILIALAVIMYVKDRNVLDIYDEGILFYGDREGKTAAFVRYEEMENWNVNHDGGHDTVEITLNDGRFLSFDTFEADEAYRTLYNLQREKDVKYIRQQKDRERPLSLRDVFKHKDKD